MNRMCIECLDKQKESSKVYNQKDVFCDICQRNVKQCMLSKHLKTDRHSSKEKLKKEEEKKQIYMEEYLKDDEARIAKLKHIWKNHYTKKTLKDFNPIIFHIIIYEKFMIRT